MARLVPFLLLPLMAACACPEITDMQRMAGYSLGTPEEALDYFREALLVGDTNQQYLVFSEALKQAVEEKQGVSFSRQNYAFARDDIIEELVKEFGPLEDVEIGEAVLEDADPDVATVELRTRTRRVEVRMIRERSYRIWFDDGASVSGPVPAGQAPPTLGDGRVSLSFPIGPVNPDDLGEGEIYRVAWFNEWKVLELPGSPFTKELQQILEKRAAEREAARKPGGGPRS